MASYSDDGKVDGLLNDIVVLSDGYGQTGILSGVSADGYLWTLTKLRDGYGTSISSTVVSAKTGLDVNIINPISTTLSNDTNFGTVGASTLRGAAQIGNATGAADFNVGTSSGQTLRVAANLADGYANRITSAAHPVQSRRAVDSWPLKGIMQHFNGTTANTSAITITPTSPTLSILIYNPGTNASGSTISASFDGGTNYFTIPLGSNLNAETEVTSFLVKGSAAGITYQILVTRG